MLRLVCHNTIIIYHEAIACSPCNLLCPFLVFVSTESNKEGGRPCADQRERHWSWAPGKSVLHRECVAGPF